MNFTVNMRSPTQRETSLQASPNGISALAILILLQIGILSRPEGFGPGFYKNTWILNTSLSKSIVDRLTADLIGSQVIAQSVQIEGESGSTFQAEPNAASSFKTPMSPTEGSLLYQQEDDQEQTITFNPLVSATYGDPVIILSAIASSGLSVTFTSDNPSVATVSGNSLTITGAGTANIIASQLGDGLYDPALEVVQVLTVNKATLSAVADNKTKIYGDLNPALTFTYSGFKGSDNASVIDVPPSLTTDASQFSQVDSYDISFTSMGNDNNYTITPLTDGTLTISKAPLSAMADNKTKIYGDPNPALTFTYSGFKGSDNASVLDTPPGLATEVTQFSPVDSYAISVISDGTDNNYTFTPLTDGILTINQATLSAIADSKTKAYGDLNPVLTISYSGFKGSDNASSIDTPPLLATNATQFSPVDLYDISFVNEGTDNDYEISSLTDAKLTVIKADQTITFEEVVGKTIFDSPFTLIATSTSGLPLSFASSNAAVISISGSTATIHGSGTTIITASQEGNTNFNAAEDVTQEVTVGNKKNQSIAFEALPDKTIGDPVFTISAISSSGLNISFETLSTNITLNGNQVTLINAGRASIRATQSGDADHNAAEPITHSFCVNPAKPVITLTNANSETPTLTSSAASGNQWFLNGNPISGAANITFNATEFGSYSVRSTVEGCASEISNSQIVVIAGDLTAYPNATALLYPVPALNQIFVSLSMFREGENVLLSIYDINGRGLYQQVATGGAAVEIDIEEFYSGLYVIKAQQGQNSIHVKFIKE